MCYCCTVCHFMSMNIHRSLCVLANFHLTAEMLHIVGIAVVIKGHAAAQLVEALHYKPEGRGFDSRWCH